MNKNKLIQITIIASILIGYSISITADTTDIVFSFSANFNSWQMIFESEGSNLSLSDENSYSGQQTAKLVGTTRISYSFIENNNEILISPDLEFNFAWYFESRQYDYIGFIIYPDSGPSYYITSHFQGIFLNNTDNAIYEYESEEILTWYKHSLNIYDLYEQYYDFVPEKIQTIHILNAYFGPGTCCGLTASNQVSYFNDFSFSSNIITSKEYNTSITTTSGVSIESSTDQSTSINPISSKHIVITTSSFDIFIFFNVFFGLILNYLKIKKKNRKDKI